MSQDNFNLYNEAVTKSELEILSKNRKILLASIIASIVSLFIGGIALSILALVGSIMGYRSTESIARNHMGNPMFYQILHMTGIICIAASVLAVVLNAIALAVVMPTIIEAMRTGDYSQLSQLLGSNASDEASRQSASSIW